MRRPSIILRLASASAMLLVGCDSGQPLEPFIAGEGITAARASGGSEVAAPSNTLATAYSATQINVSWQDNSSSENSFHIYRSLTGGTGTFTFVAYVVANTTTYQNQGLEPGVQYCYAVLATGVIRKRNVSSEFSNTACATTAPPVAAPSNAVAVAPSNNRVEIQWQDNSSNETNFEVHRSVYPEGSVFSLLTVTSGNVISFSDQGLWPTTEYCYKIRAVQVIGGQVTAWPFSNITCAWTLPNAASSTTASSFSSSAVVVVWTAVGIYFRIDRSTDGGVVWTTAGTAENTRSFVDNVEPEQAVCYRVVTYNTSGEAPPSNTDCTTPLAQPTDVTWSVIDASTVELTWRDNSNVEDGYFVREFYEECWHDMDFVWTCEEYEGNVIAVLPANTTSFRKSGGATKVSVYAKNAGGHSTGGISP